MPEFLDLEEVVRSWKCQGKCLCSIGFLWILWTLLKDKQFYPEIRSGSVSSRYPSSPWAWSCLFAAVLAARKRWHTPKSSDCTSQCFWSNCSHYSLEYSLHFGCPRSRISDEIWTHLDMKISLAFWSDFDFHKRTYLNEFDSLLGW